jgi:hypothetical protein
LIGSPQGGIVSPILANVYLHELDEFVEDRRRRLEQGKTKDRNPAYRSLANKKARMVAKGQTKTAAFRALVKQMRTLPTVQVDDPAFIRVRYLRYADDWMIGVCGSKALAQQIKEDVKIFLRDSLKLHLSEEKTRITHAKSERAQFLGTELHVGNGETAKIVLTTNGSGKRFKRRATGWETKMDAPLPKLLKRLQDKGLCTNKGVPLAKRGWAFLDLDQIVLLYSGMNRGIQNYYRFADNWRRLTRIQYILHYSLAKTLAFKLKRSAKKVFARFGRDLCIVLKGGEGKADRQVRLYLNGDWKKNREAFQPGNQPDIHQLQTAIHLRTRSKLGKPCCTCGETQGIVMHHVRQIRQLSHQREPTGFNRILRQLNRKQVPVCQDCHTKIHRGTYDALRITDLVYLPT